MPNIEDIFELLDWNNCEEDQAAGIAIANQLDDFSELFQPLTERYNKNVWDNCALVIASKTDKQLSPYAMQLFKWTADLNWPGAVTILERIKRISSGEVFISAALAAIQQAESKHKISWKWYLSDLLESEFFIKHLTGDVLKLLESYKLLELDAD